MRDKHIHIKADSNLLKKIQKEISEKLDFSTKAFNRLIWTKFIFYCGMSILLYTLLFQLQNAFLFVLCFIAYGLVALLFAFNFAHDLSHNTIFKSKKLNNIGYTIIYTIVGAHAEAWKKRHVHSHHYAPNVEDYDSDLNITNLIRVIPNSPYSWFHKYQYIYAPIAYTSYSLFWVFIKDFVILYTPDEYGSKKNFWYHLSFWMQKLIYISIIFILPITFSYQSVFIVSLGFLLMHLVQSLFLLFTFFMTHHVVGTAYPTTDEGGYINTSWTMNQIRSSNDMHPFSEVANFILGGFNNHIAHHLFPHIHHIYYPKMNKIIYEVLQNHGIKPNQTSYWGGILSHLKLLRLMGRKPENQATTFLSNHTL